MGAMGVMSLWRTQKGAVAPAEPSNVSRPSRCCVSAETLTPAPAELLLAQQTDEGRKGGMEGGRRRDGGRHTREAAAAAAASQG